MRKYSLSLKKKYIYILCKSKGKKGELLGGYWNNSVGNDNVMKNLGNDGNGVLLFHC